MTTIEWTDLSNGPAVAELKAYIRRQAERDGPCWGDVPRVPDDPIRPVLC